jgi:NitT/TauT family transport system permease protein
VTTRSSAALRWSCYLAGPVVFLVAWQVTVDQGWLNPFFFPTPLRLLEHFPQLFSPEGIGPSLWATVRRLLLIGAAAILVGIPLGVLLKTYRTVDALVEDPLAFVYAVPSIILFPLITFLVGRNDFAVVFSSAITPAIVMALATRVALQHVTTSYIEAGTNFGARGVRLSRLVIFPAILPALTSNFRVALSLGLIGLTATEMVGAQVGLGAFMWENWSLMRVDDMYLALIAIGAIGVIIAVGMDWVFRKTMPWTAETA